MSDYKKAGSKKIEGKKTKVVVYKKSGSSKLYVKRKGRMMNFVNYKKMCAKKLAAKKVSKVRKVRKVSKVSKVSKARKVRNGGSSCSQQQNGGNEELESFQEVGGILEGGKMNNSLMRNRNKQNSRNLRALIRQSGGNENMFKDLTSFYATSTSGAESSAETAPPESSGVESSGGFTKRYRKKPKKNATK